ncbi:MAG: PQQ-binding-like beta-propeller repeat protein [Victivallales bacterium]|nr:PQQ-binding-like beta-propeller repeat protein [Victivallales bacterium]
MKSVLQSLSNPHASAFYSGHVTDESGNPLAGIRVTDGFKVALTDADGAYSLERNPKTRIVSVVVSADRQTDTFWQTVAVDKTTGIDFRLTSRTRRKAFCFLQISDQERRESSLDFYHQLRDRALAEDAAFVISTGDLCDVDGIRMSAKEMTAETFGGIRAYITLGNHDLVGEQSDELFYESLCGPTRYAFVEGDVLFIVLPMAANAKRHPTYTVPEILTFVKSMLDTWPKGAPVFFFIHYYSPYLGLTAELGIGQENSFDLTPWKVIGAAYGHTHWYEASVDLPIPLWNTGQSRSGGAGNMPGAYRIFRIGEDASCTTELVESNIAPPRLAALRDAKGTITAAAFGSNCIVDAVTANIDGKKLPMDRRTSWFWTLGSGAVIGDGAVTMTLRTANTSSEVTAKIHTNDTNNLFTLENTLCLPQKTLFGKPVIMEGLAIIGIEDENNSREGGVCAVEIATGRIAWRYTTGFSVRNSLVASEQFVYGVDARNRIFKLNATDGREIWMNLPDRIVIDDNCHSAPCLGGGCIYAGCGKSLRAVDMETGKTLWMVADGHGIFGTTMSPLYDQGRLFLVSNWGYLQAFDAATGKEIWNTCGTERKLFQPTMAILPDGMILRCDGQLGTAVFHPENGELLRTMEPFVKMHTASIPLVTDDMVFCGASEVGCCAFDARTLTLRWDMKETMGASILSTVQYRGPQVQMEASPLIVDGRLICAGADGILYAVNPADGKVLARFDVGAPLIGTPAWADGHLYVPDYTGRILVFSLER